MDFKKLFCMPSPNYCVYANCQLSSALSDLNEIWYKSDQNSFQQETLNVLTSVVLWEVTWKAELLRVPSGSALPQVTDEVSPSQITGRDLRAAAIPHSRPALLPLLGFLVASGQKEQRKGARLSPACRAL